MKRALFLLSIVLLNQGCKFEDPIEFRVIDEVKIVNIQDGIINLSAEAVFSNPNEITGKLKDVNIKVNLDGKTLATITQSEALTVKPNADFRIPIHISFAMEDVQQGLLNNLMSILKGNLIQLHFVGNIKIGTFIFSQTVEVDYYEKVKLQF